MPLFPAVKFMDTVIGVDVHAVAPIPGIPVHPYVGPVYLWATPIFPSINVFINGMPACSVGALGYFFHVPQGVPVPPTPTNTPYWRRYLMNIPMVLTLTALTMLANLAIAGISALIPKPKSVENFIKDVTGIDTSSRAATWESIKGMFAAYSQWQTWVKLLMPPLPYPGAQGSVAVGSPSVTVNGGALAFVGPLLATSCSDIPVVPNAVTLGFSNVLVGVSFADMARGIAVAASQAAVQAAVQKGMDHALAPDEENAPKPAEEEEPGKSTQQNDDCDRPGHPINPVTGASESEFTDISLPGRFRWGRNLSSARCNQDSPVGFGMRHTYQHELVLAADRATYVDPRGRHTVFRRRADGRYDGLALGYALDEMADGRFVLRHGPDGTLGFERDPATSTRARLAVRVQDTLREVMDHDRDGRLIRIRQSWRGTDAPEQAEITLLYDAAGRITQILRDAGNGAEHLAQYGYDAAGCLVQVVDALGATSSFAYDADRRVVRETDANGYSFHFKYDSLGRCVGSVGDDGLWRVALRYAPGRTLVTEADNGQWVFAYDEAGTVTEILDPYGGKRQRVTGPDGRVLRDVDSGGRVTYLLYDAQGRNTGRLDRWGNIWPPRNQAPNLPNPLAHKVPATALEREWGAAPDNAANPRLLPLPPEISVWAGRIRAKAITSLSVQEKRDLRGRIVQRTDALGRTEHYRYDPAGNQVAYTDKDGALHRQEFASWNLCVAATNPLGHTTRYRHTRREKLAAIIDPGGAESKYVYDCKDRLTHIFRHGVLREHYLYDEGDHLIEKRDGVGEVLLTQQIGPFGLPSVRTLGSGEVHRLDYDSYGNVTEASTKSTKVIIGHSNGRRTSDLQNGRGVEHRYKGGMLVSTTLFGRFITRYEILSPGDMLIHHSCAPPHRIQRSGNGDVLLSLAQGAHMLSVYDGYGRCIGRTVGQSHRESDWTSEYLYSAAGELRERKDDLYGSETYLYDAAHRLIASDGAGGSIRYAYDAASNLVSTPHYPALQVMEGNRLDNAGASTFEYNSRNHLSAIVQADGERVSFFYDSMDLLIEVTGGTGCAVWKAEYDALCRRTAKIVDGMRTAYFWDGDRLIAEEGPDGRVRQYLYADLHAIVPFGFIDYDHADMDPISGKLYTVYYDQVGIPVRIMNIQGHIVWRVTRADSYGWVEVARDAQIAYNLRLPGHVLDPELGLHCNRYRTYSPLLCRYLQSDPMGQAGGANLYSYPVNPLLDVDVLGLHPDKSDASANEDPPPTVRETPQKGGSDSDAAPVTADPNAPSQFGPGTLTNGELAELQGISDKHGAPIDVIGSRAEGNGRNIDQPDLPAGKGEGTRSDIDTRIDGQNDIDSRGGLSRDVSESSNGAGTVASSTGLPSDPPVIKIRPNQPPVRET